MTTMAWRSPGKRSTLGYVRGSWHLVDYLACPMHGDGVIGTHQVPHFSSPRSPGPSRQTGLTLRGFGAHGAFTEDSPHHHRLPLINQMPRCECRCRHHWALAVSSRHNSRFVDAPRSTDHGAGHRHHRLLLRKKARRSALYAHKMGLDGVFLVPSGLVRLRRARRGIEPSRSLHDVVYKDLATPILWSKQTSTTRLLTTSLTCPPRW